MGNRNYPLGDAALPIADLSLPSARFPLDLLHRPGQDASPIIQQTAVRRVVNVGFDHRSVYPHLAAADHPPGLRYATSRSCSSPIVAGPTACPNRTSVFASGTFSIPIRQKLRYTTLARTSRSNVS